MSWQQYVDQQLIGSGCVTDAAILSIDGASVWAKSGGFVLKAGEGAKVAGAFKDPGAAQANGIVVNGTKYMTLRADAASVYGKKGNTGVVLCKTKQCILVGQYNDTIQPGQATNAVERLADYLKENGY